MNTSSKSPLHIRKAKISDLPIIKECLIDSWVEHAQNEPGLLDEQRMREVDVEGYYKEAFDSDKTVVFVAEIEGKFAGVQRADIQEIPHFYKDNKIFYLDDAYVVREYRGRGIVRKLIKEVEKVAKERGIKRIQARVYTYNKPMQRALEKLGYHIPHSTWDKLLK